MSGTTDQNHSITVRAESGSAAAAEALPALVVMGNATAITLKGTARVVPFGDSLRIGRHAAEAHGDAWVVKDDLVSKQHCLIEREGTTFVLRDLGSRNGTAVDGVPVSSSVKLRDGSRLFVGSHVAVFRLLTPTELQAMREELDSSFGPVATTSPKFARLCQTMRRLAPSGAALLLTGETGAGKEVYAHAIHQASGRRGRFVAINCAALPKELIESELFGFVRGAHSQARDTKVGLFEEADGGTLFLDEIGDMAPDLQVKMLRFLQDREVTPLGATRGRKLDVRVVAATSRTNIAQDGSVSGLRPDLLMRLGPEPVALPPLRHRIEDLGALVAHFLAGRPFRFELLAYQALALHPWPGNVRELQKVVDHAVLLCDDGLITAEHLPKAFVGREPSPPDAAHEPAALRQVARPAPGAAELEALLARYSGNVLRVARELDRKPALIYRWCERYGLSPDNYRPKD